MYYVELTCPLLFVDGQEERPFVCGHTKGFVRYERVSNGSYPNPRSASLFIHGSHRGSKEHPKRDYSTSVKHGAIALLHLIFDLEQYIIFSVTIHSIKGIVYPKITILLSFTHTSCLF